MHNYELDSLCYHLRLSYSWWKQSQRTTVFNHQWLISMKIIIEVMIIEQHHSQISPYRYTELTDNHQGSLVAYTGMTWSAFRPSDDRTKYGYLIPSNMMACVILEQLIEMIQKIFPEQIQLVKQVRIIFFNNLKCQSKVRNESYVLFLSFRFLSYVWIFFLE
jgi:meiotically up-regulated gene 157 (Mug157) protein